MVSPSDVVWTYLDERGRQIGFGPRAEGVLVTREYVGVFGVTEDWFDGVMALVPGAERWTSRRGTRGWRGVGEWKSRP